MRARWLIWILEGVTLAVVIIIFYWQLITLPNLREQIISGFENNLNKISRDAVGELSSAYSEEISSVNRTLLSKIERKSFNAAALPQIKKLFQSATLGQQLSDAWFVVFLNLRNGEPTVYEYKQPSRYRPDAEVLGSWQGATELTRILQYELIKLLGSYKTIDGFNRQYWPSAPDSTIVLVNKKGFSNIVLTGIPVYNGNKELKGFIFNKLSTVYFEKEFIRNFFQESFWKESNYREGIEKKHLQIGVFSTNGNRNVYNSVAFGKKEFEHQEALSGVNPLLSDYVIGVGFRNSSVAQVGTSVYNRTRYLIFGMFFALILLVLVIFRTARRMALLSSLKSEFVANVTHEIKTPLSSIQLAADTLRLRRGGLSQELQENCLAIIHKETDRLQEMIHTLLDFSRLEAGKKKFRFEIISVEDFGEKVKEFVKERAGTAFGVSSGKVTGGNVAVDIKGLEQVLWIFIDNALKYSPEHKQIDVGIKSAGKMLRIEIKDYGIGIPAEYQQLIFDKFVRIGNLEEHNVKGYGIGLSIAKGIVKAHNGKVGVESVPGGGSVFFFLLPILKSEKI